MLVVVRKQFENPIFYDFKLKNISLAIFGKSRPCACGTGRINAQGLLGYANWSVQM